jgi:hypothetical protein
MSQYGITQKFTGNLGTGQASIPGMPVRVTIDMISLTTVASLSLGGP